MELRFVLLLGSKPGLDSLKSLVHDRVHRVLCPQLHHPVEEEHPPPALAAVQAAGEGHGRLPLGISVVDGGLIVELEADTVQPAHGCSHVQGRPAHGVSALTVGTWEIRKLAEGGPPASRSQPSGNPFKKRSMGRAEAGRGMLGRTNNRVHGGGHCCPLPPSIQHCLPPHPMLLLQQPMTFLQCLYHSPAQIPLLASTTLGAMF